MANPIDITDQMLYNVLAWNLIQAARSVRVAFSTPVIGKKFFFASPHKNRGQARRLWKDGFYEVHPIRNRTGNLCSSTIRVIFAIRSDLLFGRSVSGLVDVPIIHRFSVGFKRFQQISVVLYDCTNGGLWFYVQCPNAKG